MAVLLLVLRMHIVTAGHFYRDIGRYNIRALHQFAHLMQPVSLHKCLSKPPAVT